MVEGQVPSGIMDGNETGEVAQPLAGTMTLGQVHEPEHCRGLLGIGLTAADREIFLAHLRLLLHWMDL